MGTYYDSISRGYNELHYSEQKHKAELILKELTIRKTDNLLDVGCGTGKVTELFPCNVTGIDTSAELLKQAKIPVIQGNAEKLPFPDKSFDLVISLTAIHNFDDVETALNEMKRIAKRDIVITVLKKAKKFGEIEKKIRTVLKVKETVDAQQDIIFFCEP